MGWRMKALTAGEQLDVVDVEDPVGEGDTPIRWSVHGVPEVYRSRVRPRRLEALSPVRAAAKQPMP